LGQLTYISINFPKLLRMSLGSCEANSGEERYHGNHLLQSLQLFLPTMSFQRLKDLSGSVVDGKQAVKQAYGGIIPPGILAGILAAKPI
jgi:hypothetical protein